MPASSFRIDQGVDHLVVGGGFAGCVPAERLASQLGLFARLAQDARVAA